MNCKEFSLLVDSYLRGDISDEKKEDFEHHYFACDKCFLDLQIQAKLYGKEIKIEKIS